MKYFRSKIDLWLPAVLCIALGFPIINGIYERVWQPLAIFMPVALFIIYGFVKLRYCIDGEVLIIKAGIMVSNRINIHDIKRIEKSNSILSSPALSLDRLSISYGKYEEILVSPKEKQAFIDALLSVNPDIHVSL
jgi:hypothetical protein